jgi:hypothetical protein
VTVGAPKPPPANWEWPDELDALADAAEHHTLRLENDSHVVMVELKG